MSYINRDEAIRLIDNYQGGAMDKPTAKKILAEMKDGVVRCEDCKHIGIQLSASGFRLSLCTLSPYYLWVNPEGYCWKGERREDG